MTLRNKTLLITAAMILGLTALVYLRSRSIVLDSFARLEQQIAHQDVARVLDTFSRQLASLETPATDYGTWDDTYTFVNAPYASYVTNNLDDSMFTNIGLNVVVL